MAATISETLTCIQESITEKFKDQLFIVTGDITEYYDGLDYIALTLIEPTQTTNEQIKVFVPSYTKEKLEIPLRNDTTIQVTGTLNSYKNFLQITAADIQVIGTTTNPNKLEEKKKKIRETKNSRTSKTHPQIIDKIAVITSDKSYGYNDFLQTLQYGNPATYYAKMQGPGMPANIATLIEQINKEKTYDCICIVRGGGSDFDLRDFNSEILTDAILKSKILIFTAIGHADNQFLCDEAADKHFITPTALAEHLNAIITKHQESLKGRKIEYPILENLKTFPYLPLALSVTLLHFTIKYIMLNR